MKVTKNVMKSILAFVMAIALVIGAVPIDGLVPVAKADGTDQDPVSYLDGSGSEKSCTTYTTLTGAESTLEAGWYVVPAENSITYTGTLTLSGDVHLILEDGATMNVGTKNDRISGVGINGAGHDFTIYGQSLSDGAGALNVYSSSGDSAIEAKNLTINGGKVTAGFDNENGGYALYSTGNIIINGGTIDAYASGMVGMAIYCENNSEGKGNITINGGNVKAFAKGKAAYGIRASGSITINDGEIDAEASKLDGIEVERNDGLYAENNIVINGGQVTSKGGQVIAEGDTAGIRANGNDGITLSWKNDTDFIKTNSFKVNNNNNNNIAIVPGKTFKDNNGKYYNKDNASEVKSLRDVTLSATTDNAYTVTFDCGEYTPVPSRQILEEGSKVTKPDSPTEGSTRVQGGNTEYFAGWYQDESYQIRYNFDSQVTSDLYLHAKWANKSNNIADSTVKMIYRYTGDDIEPVVVNNIGETLAKGTDYEVTNLKYEKTNSTVSSMKAPGFYTFTVSGKGSYTGTKEVRACVLTFGKYDSETKNLDNNATLPEGTDAAFVSNDTVIMNSGWYVVAGDVVAKSRIKVKGDVHLVLCDGATLDASHANLSAYYSAKNETDRTYDNGGISVTEGNSLTIYSQAGNTGKIVAASSGIDYYAGIGGDCPPKTYTTTGGDKIEQFPYLQEDSDRTGNAGNITIHGGEIIAKGSYGSAAIGKASKDTTEGKGGKITIYGGKITAQSYGESSNNTTGIGGKDADIHISWCRSGSDADFIQSDGYQGRVSVDKYFIIEGTSMFVDSDNINQSSGKKIVPINIDPSQRYMVTFDSNEGTAVDTQSVIPGKRAVKPPAPIRKGYKFEGWYRNSDFTGEKYDFSFGVGENLNLYAKWTPVSGISYIDADGGPITEFKNYSPMEADYTVLPSGSYYVDRDITLLERIKVEGEVNLILGDGHTLIAPMGISVMGANNALNILGQSGGTGKLSAIAGSKEFYDEPSRNTVDALDELKNLGYGNDATKDILSAILASEQYFSMDSVSQNDAKIVKKILSTSGVRPSEQYAAIGGDYSDGSTGKINIYGGTINAWGGNHAAAIGGGCNNENYGTISIYGGNVSVYSGNNAAGIGGGSLEIKNSKTTSGVVGIYGGEIRIVPTEYSTGIGGGYNTCGGDINILGGEVDVKGIIYNNKSIAYTFIGIGDGDEYTGEKKSLITLGCRGQEDYIYSEGADRESNLTTGYKGNVRIVPGQVLQTSDDADPTQFSGKISGEIPRQKLVLKHTHDFEYTDDGTTIFVKCRNEGCELHNTPATITLSAPEESTLVYDGTAKPAIVTGDCSLIGYAPVYYQKKNGDTWGEEVTELPKDAGTYRASLTVEESQSSTGPTVRVEYIIKPKDVTIIGITAKNKVYDDTTAVSVNEQAMRLDSKIAGDDVSIISGNAAFENADAGENKEVVFTGYSLAGEASGNYNLVSQPTLTATIQKRPVTIKADDQTVNCGGTLQEMNATCSQQETDKGLLTDKGHELSALTLTPDPNPRTQFTSMTGTITPDSAVIKRGDDNVTANYDITYQNGTLEVVLHLAEVTKIPTAAGNLRYSGYGNNQWLLIDPGTATTKMEYKVRLIIRGDGKPVLNEDESEVRNEAAPKEGYSDDYSAWEAGTYRVWYRAAADAGHLPSAPGFVDVKIDTMPLHIKMSDATMTYGEDVPHMDVVVDGFVTPEDKDRIGKIQYNLNWFPREKDWHDSIDELAEADRKFLVPGVARLGARYVYRQTGDVTYCYDITSVYGCLTIEKRTAELSWGDTSFTYDGKPHAPTATVTNPLNGDVVPVYVSGAQMSAGQYTATAVIDEHSEKGGCYGLASDSTTKTFSIAKADYTGVIPDVELSVPVSATSFTASVAGNMPADAGTLTYSLGSLTSNNFVATVDANGQVTVTKKTGSADPAADTGITVYVNVKSTNYNDKLIKVVATFVAKSSADITVSGDSITIDANHALSVDYAADKQITLNATVTSSGAQGTWTWESSNPEVATVSGNGSACTVTVKGVGTTGVTVKYDSDTATGYVTLFLTVKPVLVPIPTANENLVVRLTGASEYTVLTGVASDDNYYTVVGGTGGAPGDYVAVATLKDPVTYRWEDGTTDVKYIPWKIKKDGKAATLTNAQGVMPTTWENNDGKIINVSGMLEYSTDENFSNAISVDVSGFIGGLTPGVYYVRGRETTIFGVGDATRVVVPACPMPEVRARQGLVYNGSSQTLVEPDPSLNGKIYYAVTEKGYPEPARSQYTTSVPRATAAGSHFVWYRIVANGNFDAAEAKYMQVSIAKRAVTVSGIKASDKIYDGTTSASLDTSGVTLTGKIAGDTLGVTATGTFLYENVGTGIRVDINDLTLTGTAASNYVLAQSGQQTTTTADITARALSGAVTISGGTADGIKVGDSLGAVFDTAGATVTYQWLIDGEEQQGATASTFVIPAGTSAGSKVSVRVNGTGNYTGTLTSSEVGIGKKTVGNATVIINGDESVGAVLTATVSAGTSGMTENDYSLVWCRDGVVIEGATSATYTVVRGDRGHTIAVKLVAKGDFSGEIISEGKLIPAGTPVIRASASAGDAQATVNWTVDTAGQVITQYQVLCVETGEIKMVASDNLSCVFTGLTNGKAYTFTVRAVYGGSSVDSVATIAVTPKAPSSGGGGPTGGGSTGDGSSTTTVTNPDGSTTTVTTDTEGTKTTETVSEGENGSKITETVVEKKDGTTEKVTETVKQDGSTEKKTETVQADGTTIHEDVKTTAKGKVTATLVVVSPSGDRTVTESVTKPNGNYEKTTLETVVKKNAEGNIIGETTVIRIEEKSGKTIQAATFKVSDPAKKTITLTSATTTAKNGVVIIPKSVKSDGKTYKVTKLVKGMLKGSETKPKKVSLEAGGIKTVRKGAFNNLAKEGTITITGSKKQFKQLKKLIKKSGLPKGVKIKRG